MTSSPEPRPPALVLHHLRTLARTAARHGRKLDPREVLELIEGKHKA